MSPQQWRKAVGDSVWERVLAAQRADTAFKHGVDEDRLAHTLNTFMELLSLKLPAKPPKLVAEGGGRVFWPRADGGVSPVLTAEGLAKHWAIHGHGFILLRAQQMCRAVAGPLLQAFVDCLHAYEYRCEQEGVTPTIIDWRVFVGGAQEHPPLGAEAMCTLLQNAAPEPQPDAIKRGTIRGPAQVQG